MLKNQTWKIAGPVVLLLVGAVAFGRAHGPETQTPKQGRVVEGIYGLGTVNADQVYTAKTGVSLQLQQIPVKEGDTVEEGEVLARFEESSVRAPFSGTITQVSFKAGEIVPPQSPVLTLTSLDRLYLEVNLEQQSVLRVSPGKDATISFESLRDQRFKGRVKNIYPRDSQFIVRIELDQWPEGVLPGMTADVAIEANAKENALLIPVQSVDDGKVELVRDGSRQSTEVKLGAVTGEWVEVAAGDVRPDDQLVLHNQ